MLPRLGVSRLVPRWIAATLVASIIAAVDGGWLARWASLAPSRIWHGEVWRLVTWPLIEGSPLQLILTCAAIFKFGGELAPRWGDRRLQRFALEIVIAAGAATCVLATALGATWLQRLGGWAVPDALIIAWARQFPERTLVLYGVLSLNGRDLIRVTIAAAIVFAIFLGPIWMAPELIACAAATAYPPGWLRR